MNGLIVKENKQGHKVIRLHYSADPFKTPEWAEKEAAKYSGGRTSLLWRQEYEIDFNAGSGELVFPEFSELEGLLTCDPFITEKNADDFTWFGGFDWGTRNPFSFHAYAESKEQIFYSAWEYYGERQPIPVVAKNIKQCPFYDRIQWIAADPSIWTENISKKDGFTSVATMFSDPDEVGEENVIDKLMPAHDRSDVSGINKFKTLWNAVPPKFVIFKTCQNQINEFKNLKYPERREIVNETEKILDKNNHSWDDAKYFVLSHPYAKGYDEKPKFGTMKYLHKITTLASQMAEMKGTSVQEEFNLLYGTNL